MFLEYGIKLKFFELITIFNFLFVKLLILIYVGILFVNVKMIDILFVSIIIVLVNGTDNFVTKSVTGRAVINVLDDLFGQLKI